MRLGAVALVLVVLLAGCALPDTDVPDEPVNDTEVVFAEDYQLENTTIPAEELTNATLGPEHEHDAWQGAEEIVLLDDTVVAGQCEGPFDAAAYAFVQAASGNGAAYGCARISLPEGVVVPEGTGVLRVEVDASQALKAGSYQFQWRSKAHEVVEPPTSEPQHVWEVALDQDDWDIPHAAGTTFVMYLASSGGPAGAFDGDVLVRLVAVKLAGWEPILAVAHVDHWALPSMHDFPAPGVMRLLDAEASVRNIDPARITSGARNEPIPLTDIIAPGAKFVTIVADTTAHDCGPALECWYIPELIVGGYERTRFGELLFEEGGRRVYVWSVPDDVPEDSVYANASTSMVQGRIDACATGDAGGPSCGLAGIASQSATARLQAFAWKGEVDEEMLRTLADAG